MSENPVTQTTLMPARMKLQEHVQRNFVVVVENGVTRDDLLRTDFWSLTAIELRQGDRLIVYPDDMSFYAEHLVIARDRTWAKMVELSFKDLSKSVVSVKPTDEYQVVYKGTHLKHCVVRKSDGSLLAQEMQTKDEANLWLSEFLKKAA